jgi:NAD(P)H dehydrogenase (quinone)
MNKRNFLKQAGAASVAAGLVLASWSSQAQAPAGEVKVLIVYHSVTGNTEKMAQGVAEGANGVSGASVVLKKVGEVTGDELLAL